MMFRLAGAWQCRTINLSNTISVTSATIGQHYQSIGCCSLISLQKTLHFFRDWQKLHCNQCAVKCGVASENFVWRTTPTCKTSATVTRSPTTVTIASWFIVLSWWWWCHHDDDDATMIMIPTWSWYQHDHVIHMIMMMRATWSWHHD